MYKHTVYKPIGGDARIKAGREVIYNFIGKESLYAAADTYLVDITWVSKMSWKNDTDATQTYSQSHTTGLTVTAGGEVNNGFSLSASFEGIVITTNSSEKIFTSTETRQSMTTTTNISIPARSLVIFYQKRYKFRMSMFFILDAWGREWNVGSWGGYEITRKECEVVIDSEDYATLNTELDGSTTGTVDAKTVNSTPCAQETKKRDDCTGMSRDKIAEMGV